MTNSQSGNLTKSAAALTKGFFTALIIMIVGAAITALLFNFTNTGVKILNLSHYIILAAAFIIGGFITGRSCTKQSLLHSLLMAILSIVIIILATAAESDVYLLNAIFKSIIIIICASFGGILGAH